MFHCPFNGLALVFYIFLNGFKLWVEQGLDEYGAVQKDGTVDCCQIDAACADEIVQLALFGEVTFG